MSKFTLPAVSSVDLELEALQGQPEGDRGLNPVGKATVDPLEALLEQTWRLLNRPALHAHACCKCFKLRACCQQPCKYRATDLEREWDCGCTDRASGLANGLMGLEGAQKGPHEIA